MFSAVAHGAQVHERDPFDVETIHVEARETFHRLLTRAATPEHAQRGHGRMMLVLGDSGSGKTHLLRALRTQTHGQRLGYVAYLQPRRDGTDRTRHVLRSLVDSLEQPYDAPSLAESGLMYLSDGLVQVGEAISPDDLERLRVADLSAPELEHFIGGLVDRVVRSVGLDRLEVDLVQALLLLQRRDPAMQRRIVRFLRCESLSPSDRQLLGGVGSRDRADDPLRTIQQLAMFMHELQLAALVILVDEMENAVVDGLTVAQLQQALDSLRAIADAIPSSLIVIACLKDVYDSIKPKLAQGLIDRLCRDEVRLVSQRPPPEIEQLLVHRLSWLYAFLGVVFRVDDPLYPFTPAQLNVLSQLRTRDILQYFSDFQMACVAAGHVVPSRATTTPAPVTGLPEPDMLRLDTLWQETLAASVTPLEDKGVLSLVADALRAASSERGLSLEVHPVEHHGPPAVRIEAAQLPRRIVGICNNAPQRGSFVGQLAALRLAATEAAAIPIALRNGDFKFQPKSKTAQDVARWFVAGGRAVPLAESHLRGAAAALALLARNSAGSPEWRRATRALSELAFVREILDLDREPAPPFDQAISRSP
ncbi:MAG: ATP-binding protein [Kofleriaceae bacterium]